MLDLVKKIRLQIEAGEVDKNSQAVMLPVLRSCIAQVQQLEEIFVKALPRTADSSWSRGKRAFLGVIKESEVEKIDLVLKTNFDLLVHSGMYHSMSRIENKDSASLQQQMINVVISSPQSYAPQSYPSQQNYGTQSYVPESYAPPEQDYKLRSGSLSSQPPSYAPVFMVPFQRDPKFLERQSIMENIKSKFKTSRRVALAGLGGVGYVAISIGLLPKMCICRSLQLSKIHLITYMRTFPLPEPDLSTADVFLLGIFSKSQIAIEHCYRFREQHPNAHVFWIYAGSAVRFEQGYQEIARRLALPGWDNPKVDILELVHEWLSDERNGEWLMTVDNADDAAVFFGNKMSNNSQDRKLSKPLVRYLPQSSTGYIIFTTRDKRAGERLAGREKPIEILPMNAVDSLNLLRGRIPEDEWSDDEAMKLVEELAYLPLAITQAAAFISENCLTVSEYLELLATGEEDLKDLLSEDLEDLRRDLDTENSVIRTWKLSFDQISREKARAAQILSLMAVLDHHRAPRMLLRQEGETEVGFRTALGALQAFSLISAEKDKDAAVRMHRLVALSTKKWLELTGMLRHWQTEALRVLSVKFPGRDSYLYENWPVLEALTPHAQLVFSYTFSTAADLLECAKLLDFAALYDLTNGKYSEAYEKCLKSLDIRENLLPADHPLTLDSAQTLGETLLHLGELASARSMLQKAVTGREKSLGELHPDTLESVSDLTITLLELNELAAAEETALRALRGREQILGEDHPDTFVSLNILSMLRQCQGDLDSAKETTEKVLKWRQSSLGPENPHTIMTLNNLAVLQYRRGEHELAKNTLMTVLAGEEKLLGADGYDIQVSLSNLALIYCDQGELDGAESVYRRVLRVQEKLFGSKHPATLQTVKKLVDVLVQKGELDEIERMKQWGHGKERSQEGEGFGALTMAGLLFD
jgi:tetratricopeptide (TPR) repeat protein